MPCGQARTEIWDGDKLVNFDVERNRLFVKLLKEAFPHVVVLMDERIKAACAPDLGWVHGNPPMKWNHHTHMHVEAGKLK